MADIKGELLGPGEGIMLPAEHKATNSKTSSRMKAPDDAAYSVVRKFPAFILQEARAAFPKANNNTDALVAYMATMIPSLQDNSDYNKHVTDPQKDLINDANVGLYSDLSDRMLSVKRKLDLLAANDATIKLLLMLLVGDKFVMLNDLQLAEMFKSNQKLDKAHSDLLEKLCDYYEGLSKEFARLRAMHTGRPYNF